MTTPPDDAPRPDASPSAPPRSDARRVRAAAPDAAPGPDGAASPRPPQAWFTPPPPEAAPEPPPPAAAPAPANSLGEYIGILLIGAAALLLLSIFLPWTTWSTPGFGRGTLGGIVTSQSHLSYGMSGAQGEIVLLAGMAALGLALAGRAVHEHFLPYAAIPGALGLMAVFHRGVTLGDGGLTESIAWGFWIAALASVAVLALGLAALARRHPQS
ncbi:hypothetical protein GCM10023196_031700 [Actinoallomurus vinaceus]|uniref:Uncharacterized protein n=1 Tax=Actinoallomurus vinaceus TaxID=1080074 RepID=A0ABP8UAH1_9ACTN